MFTQTSSHSCYLGNDRIIFPLEVDYSEYEARYSENNQSLAFEFEDLFSKKEKEVIRQRDKYYVSYKKDHHFHISQKYVKNKKIQTVMFEFSSKIVNGKPTVFKEILEVAEFVDEEVLFDQYHKVLKQYGYKWPSPWDNRIDTPYGIQLKIQAVETLEKRRREPKPVDLQYNHDKLNIRYQISTTTIDQSLLHEKICLLIKKLNLCFWVDTKEDVIKIINNILHANLTEDQFIIKECKFAPTLGKNTHSIVIPEFGLIGFTNKRI